MNPVSVKARMFVFIMICGFLPPTDEVFDVKTLV